MTFYWVRSKRNRQLKCFLSPALLVYFITWSLLTLPIQEESLDGGEQKMRSSKRSSLDRRTSIIVTYQWWKFQFILHKARTNCWGVKVPAIQELSDHWKRQESRGQQPSVTRPGFIWKQPLTGSRALGSILYSWGFCSSLKQRMCHEIAVNI